MNLKTEWYEKPDNLVDWFEESVKKFANNNLFGTKNLEGNYEWVKYKDVGVRVDNLRGGLAKLGINKDDAVGAIVNNSVEWAVIAYATFGRGARFVPMYEKELEQMWKYIIKDSEIKVLFVADKEIYNKVKDLVNEISTLEKIIIIKETGENSMAAIEDMGEKNPVESIKPLYSDITCLIYTSGTTGEPKGVLLSHGNITSNARSGHQYFPILSEKDTSLSILPWAHSYGFTAELHCFLGMGASIAFMGSVETLGEDIQKVQPTFLIAVPRVFNKVYDKIIATVEKEGGKKKELFYAALEASKKKRTGQKPGFKGKLLSKIVFGKIRKQLGGKLKGAFTASAPMNIDIAQFFIDIGIPTFNAYGMTETSPCATMNSVLLGNRLGSVGKPIPNVKIVIDKSTTDQDADEGEIIIYGPNVMQGYWKKPEKTAEIMTPDGGVKTGDKGRIDEDGYLWITGRIKEEYKLSNGKYVHPAAIEANIKLLPYVGNCMIYGDGKPYNICLIVPDFEAIERYIKALDITHENPEQLINDPMVQKFFAQEIVTHLEGKYGGYEIPKNFAIVQEDFTLENSMLTQTMKLKRRNIISKYQSIIDSLYK